MIVPDPQSPEGLLDLLSELHAFLSEARQWHQLLGKASTSGKAMLRNLHRRKALPSGQSIRAIRATMEAEGLSARPATISGQLAPYVQLRTAYNDSITDFADKVRLAIDSSKAQPNLSWDPADKHAELRLLDQLQWKDYGPSLQSSLDNGGIQVLQLSETDEVNSIPVILSGARWAKLIDSFGIADTPYTSSLAGCLVKTDSPELRQIIGAPAACDLKASGHLLALVPDAELIEKAGLDIDIQPQVSLQGRSDVYLAYVWVIYCDAATHRYWPIYEYGNIADHASYELLVDLILDRVAFYKRRVWADPGAERWVFGAAMNDLIEARIRERFGDLPRHPRKAIVRRMFETSVGQ